jgi:septum site-determining protein MinC
MLVHRGTLRSGDHLQADGTVLLLGDVNPGARISAGGHVLVWGRLRGIAHAGCTGNGDARIVALQLRPLQLRIAAAVARGPEGSPPTGLAEEARIVDGAIQIDPAQPTWPLSG